MGSQSTDDVLSMDRFIVALLFLQVAVGLAAADLSCVVCTSPGSKDAKKCEGELNVNATDFPNTFIKQCGKDGVPSGTHCAAMHTVIAGVHKWARGCCDPATDGELCKTRHESTDGADAKINVCTDNLCNVMDPDGNGAAAITGSIMMSVMLAVALSLN